MSIMRYYSLAFLALMAVPLIGKDVFAQDANCVNQLRPCLYYLNGGHNNDPPAMCCDPLKAVIKSDPVCLCQMMSNRGASAAEQAGINITEAQTLPGKCGQNIDPLACISGSSSSRNSVQNSASDLRRSRSLTMQAVLFIISPTAFLAKPYHPFPSSDPHLKHFPLYLTALSLLAASFRYALSSSLYDPLVRGSSPVHHFLSLLTSSVLLLFLLLSFLPLIPSDLVFASAAAAFFLLSSASSAASSALLSLLQAKLFSTSSLVFLLSSLSYLILSLRPSFFVADVVLAASVCLQGFWNLQAGLSLYVESFIPEGCHLLLDVASGLRAVVLLDVVFVDMSWWLS
ncbi:hypothetical protein MLD38_023064 [Melastoma candidum]|uniref:Uncharacterized protein n=1 Tax=Melastoma candidum TaxID=119954 RepID=A0ACB9QUH3_9MYRT|nr:hypothetical protein MLD38_023064 [Melastoma candidum]